MDPETTQQLQKLIELTEQNHKILSKMQNHIRWGMFFGVMKWLLFVGLAVGSYVVVQPYIDQVMKVYKSLETTQAQNQNFVEYLKNFGNSVKYTLPR